MPPRNIVLIGFMGTGKTEVGMTNGEPVVVRGAMKPIATLYKPLPSGKTEVGKRMAEQLGYRFVDTDRLIEEKAGRSISEIFGADGEPFFRDLESGVVAEAAALSGAVISTGGGVVTRPENLRRLKAGGFVVCLQADPEIIFQRISAGSHRPLVQVADPLSEIRRLLEERKSGYHQADMTVDTSTLEVDRVVEVILGAYRRHLQEGL
ncbi:MAG: shikimate kinase [Nitrospirae bacterium]|nr:shikimate kinase [Nitrospirota bacterium]